MRNRIVGAALAAAVVFAPLMSASAAPVVASARAAVAAQDDGPSDAEQGLFTRGQNLFIQGRYEQAIVVLQDFLKTYPNSVITDLTLLWLGRSYMEMGNLAEAEQVGQRLRTIRDTPFIDIYESEIQAAREKPARPAPVRPRAEPTSTPAAVVARATPTPAPPTARQLPGRRARNAATNNVAANNTPTRTDSGAPTLAARGGGNRTRSSRRVTAPAANAAQPQTTPTTTASRGTPGGTTPSRVTMTPSRRAANTPREVASNTTTTTPPPVTPSTSDVSTSPARTSEASERTTVLSAAPSSSAEPAPQTGGLSIVVKQVPNLNLALRRASISASPGQVVQLPLAVTNTGNKEDQFRLETDLPAEFQPTFSPAQGGSDTGLPIMITPQLARNASYDVMLNLRVPDNAPDLKQIAFFVRAASQADHQIFRVADAGITVAAAALSASTNVSQETVMPGETFTQRISMRNQGSASARGSRVDFVFNPDFELVSADPTPLVYDRASRTAIWSLGDLDSRGDRDIAVTLKAVPDALAVTRSIGRGTMKTQSLIVPANFDGPSITVGRVPRARIESVSTGLTATPGDTIYIPFVVRNPGNYPEAYALQITAPGAPAGTLFADTNGDGQRQEDEPQVSQTSMLDPRGGQFRLLLRVDIPRSTPDRQQYAYNVVTRAANANRVASEASTVLTVAAPRVRVRTEQVTTEAAPGDTVFYRLVLVNDGAGLAKNLVVTEQLPEALQFISSDPSLNAQDSSGDARRFVWRVGELAPGDTAVLKIAVRLRPNIEADVTIPTRHTLVYQDANGNNYQGQ
ncbi:MAG TPA: tetratricopeptide repeat protein [Pyrinomonadaceae bacterium]|nr:tetratricopeptide repeat protein [Pyrinomonadaceae bacterium]